MRSVWPARRAILIGALALLTAGGLAVLPSGAGAAASPGALAGSARGAGQPGSRLAPAAGQPTGAFVGLRRPAVLPAGARLVCPPPARPGQMQCMSIERVPPRGTRPDTAAAIAQVGYSPANLRSAYGLTTASRRKGRGQTVAIVDAFTDPPAAHDLARYRAHFGLPPCTMSSGCLRIVNSRGHAGPLPKPRSNWAFEESLDLDMVSAICPRCHILLIEAHSASTQSLGIAEDRAVRMGARFISNSWSSPEFAGEQAFDHYFNHPGIAITFASGDAAYGAAYPADIQYVTAVGGTTLRRARNHRGWSERVWSGTGSGCSTFSAKAPWQTADNSSPNGCLNRTGNDVAADASVSTGVAVYDTYQSSFGWVEAGGTSVGTPIIASIYALAGRPTPRTYPAQYPYQHARHFHDVISGTNGSCETNRQYLCNGEPGYDAPTGLGTPAGITAFASPRAQRVTLLDPGTQVAQAGSTFSLTITGLDTRSRAKSLAYSGGGSLPAGLSVTPAPGSTNGLITGTLPASTGAAHVTITATDTATGKAGQVTFTLVTVPSLTSAGVTSGELQVLSSGQCLAAAGTTAGSATGTAQCNAALNTQSWAYVSDGAPDGAGTLALNGLCLGVAAASGSPAILDPCTGAAGQSWQNLGLGVLRNQRAGLCLSSTGRNSPVISYRCTGGEKQAWSLPGGLEVSGVSGVCLGQTAFDHATAAACSSAPTWAWTADGFVELAQNPQDCLDAPGLDGTTVSLTSGCDGAGSQLWLPGPGGELVNALSGKCLSDPASGGPGTNIEVNDCYGLPGEIWASN